MCCIFVRSETIQTTLVCFKCQKTQFQILRTLNFRSTLYLLSLHSLLQHNYTVYRAPFHFSLPFISALTIQCVPRK